MNGMMIFGVTLPWLAILAGGWLGWQLLRQNGRLLLRLEEIEQRLDELESGALSRNQSEEVSDPKSEGGSQHAEVDQSLVTSVATNGEGRANRFGNRSLAKSKLKRDGLKAGTAAPEFRLPRLDGRGELALEELRGRRVLLVFSDPHCGPCNALAPELEKFHRENLPRRGRNEMERDRSPVAAHPNHKGVGELAHFHPIEAAAAGDRPRSDQIAVVMISRGEPKENRLKLKEHGLTFPVVLQQQWEISRRYAMFATPVAYLIDEAGVIAQDVAVGTEAIQELMTRAERLRAELPAVV
jgi:peroxiredoxin